MQHTAAPLPSCAVWPRHFMCRSASPRVVPRVKRLDCTFYLRYSQLVQCWSPVGVPSLQHGLSRAPDLLDGPPRALQKWGNPDLPSGHYWVLVALVRLLGIPDTRQLCNELIATSRLPDNPGQDGHSLTACPGRVSPSLTSRSASVATPA